ncbi:MAG: pentapeptide repeat-containing protein [Planctomycetota bacterium]
MFRRSPPATQSSAPSPTGSSLRATSLFCLSASGFANSPTNRTFKTWSKKAYRIQPVQFQPVQFRPVQFQPVQFQPVQFQPVQFQPVQFQPVQFQPVQFRPVQFRPVQFQPVQFRPVQVVGWDSEENNWGSWLVAMTDRASHAGKVAPGFPT